MPLLLERQQKSVVFYCLPNPDGFAAKVNCASAREGALGYIHGGWGGSNMHPSTHDKSAGWPIWTVFRPEGEAHGCAESMGGFSKQLETTFFDCV